MTDQDNVWLLANAAVDGTVLEMPEARMGQCSLYKGLLIRH